MNAINPVTPSMTISNDLMALCKKHGVRVLDEDDTMSVLEAFPEQRVLLRDTFDASDLTLYRNELRKEILAKALVNEEQETEFSGEFYGSGDSGNYDINTSIPAVDYLLERLLETNVTFDWYNNDGGYGDITWDVRTNAAVINGYQYETTSHPIMIEEEV